MAIVRFINATSPGDQSAPASGFRRPDIKQEVLVGLRKYFYIAGGIGVLIAAYDLVNGRRSTGGESANSETEHAEPK